VQDRVLCRILVVIVLHQPAPLSTHARSAIGSEEGTRKEIAEGLSRLLADTYIRILVKGQESVVRTARSIFPILEKASDEPTADLLTQRMQTHEKTAWMLRSLLA
jgi:starvation-inducible DNA-binding protein